MQNRAMPRSGISSPDEFLVKSCCWHWLTHADVVADMTSVSLSTAAVSVTSPFQSCLPVQVPIETGSSVSNVTLGVSAAVGIIIGALVALVVSWLVFRQCLGKVCHFLYVF